MEKAGILFFGAKIFFSGIIVFAVIQFSFIYYKMPRKEVRTHLILSCIASLYILSDTLSSFFTVIIPHEHSTFFFGVTREAVTLSFFFLAPFYLNRVFILKKTLQKINRAFLITGFIAVPALVAAAVINPDLLFTRIPDGSEFFSGGVFIENNAPLIKIRNIILMIHLSYAIILILIPGTRKKSELPLRTLFTGLVIISYFAFNYLYAILFSRHDVLPVTDHFPYLGLSVVIFITFLTFAVIHLFINYYTRIVTITNDLRSELYYDSDLQVPNRISFRKDLNFSINEAHESGEDFALLMFDIDNFHNIRESYGERFSDKILKMLIQRLIENFTLEGVLYRTGDTEFSFILNDMDTEEQVDALASKVLSSLKNPFMAYGASYTLTVSIAVLILPRDGNDIDTIIDNAYHTLSSAKKIKNTYEFFSNNLREKTITKIFTVDLLSNCISNDEFTLVYQPIVDVNGDLMYAEALLRCTNKDPAIGGPDNFIPIIEKAGMTKDLDNLVVRRAFYDMEMKIKNRFGISLNMTANQLTDPDYGEFLLLFAKQHGIEPGQLVLEITESTLVQNIELARESLMALKQHGFSIAIDDFGKGFSSLTYLVELPVDILKIDMAFVHAVPGDPKKETLVKYIMELGNALNFKVVAEGFELPEQVDFFKDIGCNYFQGYYFSKPLSIHELLKRYSYT